MCMLIVARNTHIIVKTEKDGKRRYEMTHGWADNHFKYKNNITIIELIR